MPPANRMLIQVVSQLKPARCGVSDQAILLAQELESSFNIGTAFVVLNSTEPCDLPFPRVYCPPSRLLEACTSLIKSHPGAILVHCSGYGYSPDGAPFMLAEALERVRATGQFRIGAYFHELYATGMPWRSAFWYTRRQKDAVCRIAKECDVIATSLTHFSDWLERRSMQGKVIPLQKMALFSNVGESLEIPPMSARQPVMAVFGLPSTRKASYRRLSQLGSMLNALGVEEILDIGPEFDAPLSLNGIPVRSRGVLSATDAASLLARSMFGFVPHPPFCLAKSSILACFCAFGTIPVLAESFERELDGLTDGLQLISPKTAKAALAAGLERSSAAAWDWYSGHRLHVHAETYSRLLLPQPATRACSH